MEDTRFLGAVVFILFALICGAVIQWLVSLIKRYKPPTSILWFTFGMLICVIEMLAEHPGGINSEEEPGVEPGHPLGLLGMGIGEAARVNSDILFYLLLPILLYDGTQNINWHYFKKTIKPGLMLAVLGVLVQVGIIGVLMQYSFTQPESGAVQAADRSLQVATNYSGDTLGIFSHGVDRYSPQWLLRGTQENQGFQRIEATEATSTFTALASANDAPSFAFSMMVASAVASTDPIAVTSILEAMGTPPDFSSIFEVESMINDGSSIFLFTFFRELAGGVGQTWGHVIVEFLRLLVVGPIFGLALAAVFYRWLKHFRWYKYDKTLAVVFGSYLSFFVAEIYLGTSGPLTIVAFGLYFKAYAKAAFEAEALYAHHHFVRACGIGATSLVFILTGVASFRMMWDAFSGGSNSESGTAATKLWRVPVFYAYLILARFLMLGLFSPLIKKWTAHYTWKEYVLLSWGGLRGGVCLLLALIIEQDESITTELSKSAALYIASSAFLVLVVNGLSFEWLYKWLHPYKPNAFRQVYLKKVMKLIDREYFNEVILLQQHWLFERSWALIYADRFVPRLGQMEMDQWGVIHLPEIKATRVLRNMTYRELRKVEPRPAPAQRLPSDQAGAWTADVYRQPSQVGEVHPQMPLESVLWSSPAHKGAVSTGEIATIELPPLTEVELSTGVPAREPPRPAAGAETPKSQESLVLHPDRGIVGFPPLASQESLAPPAVRLRGVSQEQAPSRRHSVTVGQLQRNGSFLLQQVSRSPSFHLAGQPSGVENPPEIGHAAAAVVSRLRRMPAATLDIEGNLKVLEEPGLDEEDESLEDHMMDEVQEVLTRQVSKSYEGLQSLQREGTVGSQVLQLQRQPGTAGEVPLDSLSLQRDVYPSPQTRLAQALRHLPNRGVSSRLAEDKHVMTGAIGTTTPATAARRQSSRQASLMTEIAGLTPALQEIPNQLQLSTVPEGSRPMSAASSDRKTGDRTPPKRNVYWAAEPLSARRLDSDPERLEVALLSARMSDGMPSSFYNHQDERPVSGGQIRRIPGYRYDSVARIRSEPGGGIFDAAALHRFAHAVTTTDAGAHEGFMGGTPPGMVAAVSEALQKGEYDGGQILRTKSVPVRLDAIAPLREMAALVRQQGVSTLSPEDRDGEIIIMTVNAMKQLYTKVYEQGFISGTVFVGFMSTADVVIDFALMDIRKRSRMKAWTEVLGPKSKKSESPSFQQKRIEHAMSTVVGDGEDEDNALRSQLVDDNLEIFKALPSSARERFRQAKSRRQKFQEFLTRANGFEFEWFAVSSKLRAISRSHWKVFRDTAMEWCCPRWGPAYAMKAIRDPDDKPGIPRNFWQRCWTKVRAFISALGARQKFPALDDLQLVCAFVDVHQELLMRGDTGLRTMLGPKMLESYQAQILKAKATIYRLMETYPDTFGYAMLCHAATFLLNLKIELTEEQYERGLLLSEDRDKVAEALREQLVEVNKFKPPYIFT